MNILLVGSGGREHALAWAIARSPRCEALYIAPGNAGMFECGTLVGLPVGDHGAVARFCAERAIDFVVIGPEAPLVAGMADDLMASGFKVFGPTKAAARLEASKSFTKALCDERGIPTARYAWFDELAPALDYVRRQGAPIVVKADGLASGKGVTVALTIEQAAAAIVECFTGRHGEAGMSVVVEECLVGEEASVFALSDGERVLMLASAQDHKRARDGDMGPNTGGMGAYSPAPVVTEMMMAEVRETIIAPAVKGLAARGTPFRGVLFAGLMITDAGPKLIEFNVRFGDPEAQALMMRLKSDIVDLMEAAAAGSLEGMTAKWRDEAALCVVMSAKGYPGSFRRGTPIGGLDGLDGPDLKVFHAATSREGGRLVADGGRVLGVTALGASVSEAQRRAYAGVDRIDWADGFCRRDIGWQAVAREHRAAD
ncbi:MAG: phosphoribosylamine--glycine ligase [Cucumibacter sp.]